MSRSLVITRVAAAVTAVALAAGLTPNIGYTHSVSGLYHVADVAQPVTLTGLDAHDGTVVEDAGTYYLYGTKYACGFQWGVTSTPFCGFGVWTSTALAGPWAYQGLLFHPGSTNTARGESWQATCGATGAGCFNPRMVKRHDGVWILYFNAPGDLSRAPTRSNAYYAMGCNSPAGGCGAFAGAPYGSTRALPMGACSPANGDFSVVVDGPTAYIVCTMFDATITIEQLDYWWTTGTNQAVRSIAYLTSVEAPGVFRAPDGMWVMTFSDPICGYCSGTGTGYIVAQTSLTNPAPSASLLGVWMPPANAGWSAPATGRRLVSGTSCGGQPRTVFTVGGQAYQWIDLWYGAANETNAGIRMEPLTATGQAWRAPADGTLWQGALRPFGCAA